MKIRPCILIAFAFISATVWSQENKVSELPKSKKIINKVEIVAGPTLQFPNDNGFSERLKQASMGTILTSFNSKYGYSLGAGLVHSLSNKFDITGRVLWERKGYIEKTFGINGFEYIGDSKNDYLSLYIQPTFFLGKRKNMQIIGGLYYSWLQGTFRTEKLSLNGQTTISTTTNDPNLKSNDFGLTLGAGYSIAIDTKSKIAFLLQGNYGLSKIIDINTLTINNNSISFFVTYSRSRFSKQKY